MAQYLFDNTTDFALVGTLTKGISDFKYQAGISDEDELN